MSDTPKKSIPGPFIAVGLIVIIWIGVEFWPNDAADTPPIPTAPVAKVLLKPVAVTAPPVVDEGPDTSVVVEDASYALEGVG